MTRERVVYLYPLFLFCGWSCAWWLSAALSDSRLRDTGLDLIYWITASLLIWIVPVWFFLRRRRLNAAGFLGLHSPGRGIGIGLMIGVGVLLFALLLDLFFGGASVVVPVLDLMLIYGTIVTPTVQEIALRGFYTRAVAESGMPQGTANWYAALLFVAIHLPGWYFQARLRSPLSLFQPALFLLLLALFLGWLKDRTESLWVPIIVHVMNNIYAAFRG